MVSVCVVSDLSGKLGYSSGNEAMHISKARKRTVLPGVRYWMPPALPVLLGRFELAKTCTGDRVYALQRDFNHRRKQADSVSDCEGSRATSPEFQLGSA